MCVWGKFRTGGTRSLGQGDGKSVGGGGRNGEGSTPDKRQRRWSGVSTDGITRFQRQTKSNHHAWYRAGEVGRGLIGGASTKTLRGRSSRKQSATKAKGVRKKRFRPGVSESDAPPKLKWKSRCARTHIKRKAWWGRGKRAYEAVPPSFERTQINCRRTSRKERKTIVGQNDFKRFLPHRQGGGLKPSGEGAGSRGINGLVENRPKSVMGRSAKLQIGGKKKRRKKGPGKDSRDWGIPTAFA